jgi:hypothetical protein
MISLLEQSIAKTPKKSLLYLPEDTMVTAKTIGETSVELYKSHGFGSKSLYDLCFATGPGKLDHLLHGTERQYISGLQFYVVAGDGTALVYPKVSLRTDIDNGFLAIPKQRTRSEPRTIFERLFRNEHQITRNGILYNAQNSNLINLYIQAHYGKPLSRIFHQGRPEGISMFERLECTY